MKPPSGGPDDRADQGRDGQGRQRLHDLVARHAAQQHQAADRHHHGAAHALDEAGDHEAFERIGGRAGERARHEHADARR